MSGLDYQVLVRAQCPDGEVEDFELSYVCRAHAEYLLRQSRPRRWWRRRRFSRGLVFGMPEGEVFVPWEQVLQMRIQPHMEAID